MPINTDDVKVGHCYVKASGQHRRVVRIEDDGVTYESWGKEFPKGSLSRNKVNIEKFAAAVDREVPCPSAFTSR